MLLLITWGSVLLLSQWPTTTVAFSIRELIEGGGKRTAGQIVACPAWHPFQCPNGDCVPIKYLCDGSPDCADEYDENKSMCTAATRPPVEETASFLKALLSAHGKDFLVKVFGPKAADTLKGLGGIDKVAVALSRKYQHAYFTVSSESPTAEAFGAELKLSAEEVLAMSELMVAVAAGDTAGLSTNEATDFRFFVQKLHETGFF